MPADGYAVNIEALGKLISELETAADRITDANKKLAGAKYFGVLGNETLGEASSEFEESWEYGIEELGEAAEGVTERLVTARQKYQKVEEEYQQFFPESAEGMDGPVGGGWTGGIGDILGGGR